MASDILSPLLKASVWNELHLLSTGATTTDQMSAQVAGLAARIEAVNGLRRQDATQLAQGSATATLATERGKNFTNNSWCSGFQDGRDGPEDLECSGCCNGRGGIESWRVRRGRLFPQRQGHGQAPPQLAVHAKAHQACEDMLATYEDLLGGLAGNVTVFNLAEDEASSGSGGKLHRRGAPQPGVEVALAHGRACTVIQSVFAPTTNPEDRQAMLNAAEGKVKHLNVTLTPKTTVLLQTGELEQLNVGGRPPFSQMCARRISSCCHRGRCKLWVISFSQLGFTLVSVRKTCGAQLLDAELLQAGKHLATQLLESARHLVTHLSRPLNVRSYSCSRRLGIWSHRSFVGFQPRCQTQLPSAAQLLVTHFFVGRFFWSRVCCCPLNIWTGAFVNYFRIVQAPKTVTNRHRLNL